MKIQLLNTSYYLNALRLDQKRNAVSFDIVVCFDISVCDKRNSLIPLHLHSVFRLCQIPNAHTHTYTDLYGCPRRPPDYRTNSSKHLEWLVSWLSQRFS